MNRRSRRRAARAAARRPAHERRPLPPALRLLLCVVGAGLIVFGIVLAAHGTGARGGRVIGALALFGLVLIALAWQGKI